MGWKMLRFYTGCFLMVFIVVAIQNLWDIYGYSSRSLLSVWESIMSSAIAGSIFVFLAFFGVFHLAYDASIKLDKISGHRYPYFIYGAVYPVIMAGLLYLMSLIGELLPFGIGIIFAAIGVFLFIVALAVVPALFVHAMIAIREKNIKVRDESLDS